MWNQSDSNDSQKMNVSIPAAVDNKTETNLFDLKKSSGFIGGGTADDQHQTSKTDLLIGSSGCVDSGFLSGPQLESCEIDFDEDDANEINVESEIKATTASTVAAAAAATATVFAGEADTTSSYIDSGCIDEDDHTSDQQSNFNNRLNKATETEQTGQMILDNGIDSGLTEWFCNLSLKTNQPVNNLGTTTVPTNSKKFTNNVKETNITSSNCSPPINKNWEIYYQQNSDGDTQLHLACITGYVNVIGALIRMAPHPCFLDIQNDEAQSALHIATLTAQPLVIRMLLVAGAEPTLRDRNGNTPLHLACISGDSQCVRALTIPISTSEIQESQRLSSSSSSSTSTITASTKANIIDSSCSRTQSQPQYFPCAQLPTDLEIRNYDGERCVHLAAQGSHIEVLRHLVWFGADINAREGKSGRTPLHIAVEQCNEILANFLLEECQQKINLETVTYSGLTPYQFACIVQNQKIQNDLEKLGAEPLTPPDSDTDGSDIESELDDSQIYDNFGDPGYFIPTHTMNLRYECCTK